MVHLVTSDETAYIRIFVQIFKKNITLTVHIQFYPDTFLNGFSLPSVFKTKVFFFNHKSLTQRLYIHISS